MAKKDDTVRVVTARDSFDELESDWERLYAVTPEVTGFQSHQWLKTCWEHLAPSSSSLYISVVERDGAPVAIFPTARDAAGILGFIGRESSNYAGPVYEPQALGAAVTAWGSSFLAAGVRGVELTGLREDSPFTAYLLRHGLPTPDRDRVVRTNICPEINLSQGWEVRERYSRKTLSTWSRKERRLSRLGPIDHAVITAPEAIAEELQCLFPMWEARFKGQRISGSFTKHRQPFHLAAARAAAGAAVLRLDLLRVDGKPIAFSYGIRNPNWTTSYILAHDDRFGAYSPGLLLLLRVLETATTEGDSRYDFSLGRAPYKSTFATQETSVYAFYSGHRSFRRATKARLRVRARSVQRLRRLKLEGPRALLPRSSDVRSSSAADEGTKTEQRFVYEITAHIGDSATSLRSAGYKDIRRLLPADAIANAIDRTFKGDQLLICEGTDGAELGTIWLLAEQRGREVVGDRIVSSFADRPVYEEPMASAPATLTALLSRISQHGDSLIITREPVASADVNLLCSYAG